jgi:4-amino-4-deoxy-L-arabinose transferase-like glycosyltransferase
LKAYWGPVLVLWVLWAGLFILRSPSGAFTHDFREQTEHTQIIYNERRLALPREGLETYQPPLYYLVNAFLSPNHIRHAFVVRLMSMLYGGLTLLITCGVLTRCGVPWASQWMVLSFIATTPAFLFMFTTYNNDSLATLLSVAMLGTAFEWFHQERPWLLAMLVAVTTAGLYTKLNVLFPFGALVAVLGFLGFTKRMPWIRVLPVLAALIASATLLTPWLIGHNYRYTHQLTPARSDILLDQNIQLLKSPLRTVLTPPGWSSGEWKDPYTHVWDKVHHKKNSYLAYLFSTSIFGEYTFGFLPLAIAWALVFMHAGLWLAALVRGWSRPIGLLCLSVIALGILFLPALLFRAPYSGFMDFRFIAWIWLPESVLYATSLLSSPARTSSETSLFRTAMIIGTALQGVIWLALIMGGRWNIPW